MLPEKLKPRMDNSKVPDAHLSPEQGGYFAVNEAQDGSSRLVAWIANVAPTWCLNCLEINGKQVKSTEFASRSGSGISDAIYDPETQAWSGSCRSCVNGKWGRYKWTINVRKRKFCFHAVPIE